MNSEPPASTADIDLLAWFEVNKNRLAVVTGVLLVVGFGGWSYRTMSLQKETAASAALLKIQMISSMAENPTSPPASTYTEMAGKHTGTRAAERALLLAADASFTEQKFAEAQAAFEKFLQAYPSSFFAASAAYGVAASLEAQRKLPEATAAYQDVVTRFAGSGVVGQAKLSLARIHEAGGKHADALKIYEELGSGTSFSSWVNESNSRRDALLSRHPELATAKPATNAAAPAASASPIKTEK